MYELITDKTLAEYEAFVQSHPKGNFAQSSLWAKQKPMWTWDAVAVRGEDGKIKGSLALMTRKVPGTGRTLRDHFLAADLHAYALALGQANIIAPFLVEGRHKLIFRFALDVQTEDIARLDGLKILPALLAPEAERLHKRGKGGVA